MLQRVMVCGRGVLFLDESSLPIGEIGVCGIYATIDGGGITVLAGHGALCA